jgi:hypothetical protein
MVLQYMKDSTKNNEDEFIDEKDESIIVAPISQ